MEGSNLNPPTAPLRPTHDGYAELQYGQGWTGQKVKLSPDKNKKYEKCTGILNR